MNNATWKFFQWISINESSREPSGSTSSTLLSSTYSTLCTQHRLNICYQRRGQAQPAQFLVLFLNVIQSHLALGTPKSNVPRFYVLKLFYEGRCTMKRLFTFQSPNPQSTVPVFVARYQYLGQTAVWVSLTPDSLGMTAPVMAPCHPETQGWWSSSCPSDWAPPWPLPAAPVSSSETCLLGWLSANHSGLSFAFCSANIYLASGPFRVSWLCQVYYSPSALCMTTYSLSLVAAEILRAAPCSKHVVFSSLHSVT